LTSDRASVVAIYPGVMTNGLPSESWTHRRRWLAVGLAVAAGVWVAVNGPVEGPVLLVFTPEHGLTVADLPAIAAVIVAGVLFFS
jgi:hypothetical protein